MALMLAIEPDRRQTSRLTALAKNTLDAELVAAETTDRGVAALGGRVPDLILTSLLLSRPDESALADWLRELDAAGVHVPTLVIPVLGSARRRSERGGGLLNRLTGRSSKGAAPECDPAVFAAQIAEYLERADEERRATALAVQDELDSRQSAVDDQQSKSDSHQLALDSTQSTDDSVRATGDNRPSAILPEWQALVSEPLFEEASPVEEPDPVAAVSEPVVFEEPVLQFVEPVLRFEESIPQFEEPIAQFEGPVPPLVEPEPAPIAMPEPGAFLAAPDPIEVADAVTAREDAIVLDRTWDEIVLDEESDQSLELTAEAIDLEKFVAELNAAAGLDGRETRQTQVVLHGPAEPAKAPAPPPQLDRKPANGNGAFQRQREIAGEDGDVVSDFVEALEMMAATETNSAHAAEPDRPGAHSGTDSDLWPLSVTAACPQLEGGIAKPGPAAGAAPPPAPGARRGRRKKRAAPPLQDEWGFFDPDRCGFAALLAKLDDLAKDEQPE